MTRRGAAHQVMAKVFVGLIPRREVDAIDVYLRKAPALALLGVCGRAGWERRREGERGARD